jgi:hypothetical protein
VPGEKFGLGRDRVGEIGFEHGGDASVDLLTPAAQQRAVGGILYQRVLEGVLGIRR